MGSLTNVREHQAEELWQAHAQVWNMMLNHINSMSLKCAIDLGIPDIIHTHGEPIPLSLLLSKLSIPPARADCFRRIMRLLVHSGVFAQSTISSNETEEAYGLTAISSTVLLKEKSMLPFLRLALDPVMTNPWQCLGRWLTTDGAATTPFELMNGKAVFELAGEVPEFNNLFNDGMAGDAHFVASVIIRDRGDDIFRGLSSLVDIGGGNGAMAMAIAEAFPHVKCTVFDLPHVVASLEGSAKVEAVGGNMFEFIPPADAVLLKWVLHDWSDEDCVKILKRCKEAIPCRERGGKVIIIEMVMKLDNGSSELDETELLFDMLMMCPSPGKERSEQEWKNIFAAAGFLDYTIMPILGLRSVIELYY
ncbi:hypothetical protein Cni_G14663 [Canna indica]|uniref:Uncharacterized protein n=1 Tax=Canna indica TaxID=4628 RepID=A0AAQ3KCI0_9LILI|nr:hypothetical protein Cni_G14663 [Canna indica]